MNDIALHGAREASRALRMYEWLPRTEGCEGKIYDGEHALVLAYLRAVHYMGAKVKAWCLLIHAEYILRY